MKWMLRLVLRLLFRFRAYNEEVLRAPGPVLLIPNHVSWIDWLFLGVCLDEDWKFVVSRNAAQATWVHRKIALNRRTFPIDMQSPYGVKAMAEFLQGTGGRPPGRLVLFAEGRISRTGRLMKLFDGTGFLLHKTGAKVVTCYLRGAHRTPYSPNRDRKLVFPRVTAHFSELITPPDVGKKTPSEARDRLTNWLLDQMIEQQFDVEMKFGAQSLLGGIIEAARRAPGATAIEDVTTQKLSYRKLLAGASLLGEELNAVLAREEERVGVLLPNANVTPVILLALWSIGKVPAILNYSSGPATMVTCSQLAGLKRIVTSRTFLEKGNIDCAPLIQAGFELVYVEDLRKKITRPRQLTAILRPFARLKRAPESKAPSERAAVVLFTSGSEGVPKAVELSHGNLLANMRQVLVISDIQDWDRLFNSLPLFHSFGLTIGTLLPLMRGIFVFLYVSPLHYRVVPNMIYLTDSTIVLATNTFLQGYARSAHPMDFRSVRYLFAGAEKVQESTFNIWTRQFGVRILEGYGATECSPVVSVNVPNALKLGTAGRLMPGMTYKLEPMEGVSEGGRLLVKGPNIMRGYLNADANAKFKKLGGWYDTGDIVRVDEDRFVAILGRARRFAKVSGEMISLTAVEDALTGAFPQFGDRFQIAVISRPDEERGEALVAATNEPKLRLEEVRNVLRDRGFPNLAVPKDIRVLGDLPVLTTGKVNHRELERMV